MTSVARINISSISDDWRGVALSNFTMSPFVLGDILMASVEGFIQGIKFPPGHDLRDEAFVSSGWKAKNIGASADREGAYWDGRRFDYGSPDHHRTIATAIRARFAQNKGLQAVLLATKGAEIVHETGMEELPTTSLPTKVFLEVMNEIRRELSSP